MANTAEPTPTLSSPNPQKNQPVIACDQPGRVQRYDLPSELMGEKLPFSVYFPPCYGNGVQDAYPTLYLLHGLSFDDTQWQRLGILPMADQLIQNGRTVPFIIVMPFEQYQYRRVENNRFPLALVNELIPWVEDNLGAKPGKLRRAIGGISRGASWAVRIGLQHWDLFGAIGAHSLSASRDDLEYLPKWLDVIPADQIPRIYLDIGSTDPAIKDARKFEAMLKELGVLPEWHLNDGRHNEEYWQAHVGEYLRWYTLPWQILPSP